MAATGEDSSAAEIQVIEKNPKSSQGKSMISERDNTAEVISQAIQSRLAAMLPNMIHETLAKKNLKGTAESSQTLNTSSNSLSRLATRSTQGSNISLSVRSAARSTQGLNNGYVENSDSPSKKQSCRQVPTRILVIILQFLLGVGTHPRNCLVF